MSHKPLPYIQLYFADYRRDTRHLTTEQHGAYLLMLMAYWEQQGALSERHMQRASELGDDAWSGQRDTLAEFFVVDRNGMWKHRRIERDLKGVRDQQDRYSNGSRKGMRSRRRSAAEAGTPFRPRNSRAKNTPGLAEWRELRAAVFERDGYVCTYCGVDTDAPHCDHVMPVSRGGSSALDNLTTACPRCNLSKGSKTVDEWRAAR